MDQYTDLVKHYDALLELPVVQAAPKRSSLEHNRKVLQELLDGEPMTLSRIGVYGAAMKHKYQGLSPEELGYDRLTVDLLEEEAQEIIRDLVPALYDRADATGLPGAGEIVEQLDMGVYPKTALDMVKLLALLLNSEEALRQIRKRGGGGTPPAQA